MHPRKGQGPMSDAGRAREPKACRTCANAKVRCEQESNDGICKRCRRLNKQCTMQSPGAHKRNNQKSDVARLEQKLDSMAALLAASQQLSGSGNAGNPGDKSLGQGQNSTVLPISPTGSSMDQQVLLNEDEAELMLDMFRRHMAPQFPFVVIPLDMTAATLKQKKPFLHLTVMMVSFQGDASRQLALGIKIKEYLSDAMLMRGEKNIDLLQGLLVGIAWHHLQLKLGAQLSNIVHLMLALVIDLSLNKSSKVYSRSPFDHLETLSKGRPPQAERTLEERRAFLGCFYVTSIVSMCIKDMEPLRFTDYTKECCQIVAEAREYPTDQYLVSLVRMHSMTDRIGRMLSCDESDPPGHSLSAPLGMCIRLIENELQVMKASISREAPQNTFLLIHYYTLEIWLHEVALLDNIPASRYGNYTTTRLNLLYSCLTSTESLFKTIFSLPGPAFITMPYFFYAEFGHAIMILSKLQLLRDPNWDCQYVASVLDLPTIIDTLIGKINIDIQPPFHVPEMFRILAPRMRVFKELHSMVWNAQNEREREALLPSQVDVASLADEQLQEMISDMAVQFPNEASWQDFMFG